MQNVEFSFNEVLIRQANRLRRIERDYNEEFLGYKQRIQSLNIPFVPKNRSCPLHFRGEVQGVFPALPPYKTV